MFRRRLPQIQEELQNSLRKTEESLRQLPKAPSDDPFSEIVHLLGNFNRDLARHLEGTPHEDGLIQSIRPAQQRFKRAIRSTAPNFRPYERRFALSRSLPRAKFLSNEDGEDISDDETEENGNNIMYIDEVLKRAQRYVQPTLFCYASTYILFAEL